MVSPLVLTILILMAQVILVRQQVKLSLTVIIWQVIKSTTSRRMPLESMELLLYFPIIMGFLPIFELNLAQILLLQSLAFSSFVASFFAHTPWRLLASKLWCFHIFSYTRPSLPCFVQLHERGIECNHWTISGVAIYLLCIWSRIRLHSTLLFPFEIIIRITTLI